MATSSSRRTKIAVLGGGIGGMTSAFELTATAALRERYEVTVYQEGWALGGKCASGRDADASQRIEEHGLHMLMGFYDNAFSLLRRCYGELGRPAGAPLARFEDAFGPRTRAVFAERLPSDWRFWSADFPTNDLKPGLGRPVATPWDYLVEVLRRMDQAIRTRPADEAARAAPPPAFALPSWIAALVRRLGVELHELPSRPGFQVLSVARRLAESLPRNPRWHLPGVHRALRWLLRAFSRFGVPNLQLAQDASDAARRLFVLLDLGQAVVRGMLVDGLLWRSFDVIDDVDFIEWLGRNGAREPDAAPVRTLYCGAFAFEKGDTNRPRLAGGVGLRGMLRLFLDYRGALMWEMQAGMGETIFAPLYELLVRRGVRFEFFHRATRLEVPAGGSSVERIHLARQARAAGAGYEPLVDVGGLPCWPSEPLYDQLVDGEALRALRPRMHQVWPAPEVETRVLERGRDFDHVVVAIPPAALGPISGDVARASPRWATMLEALPTVRTIGVQLWFTRTLPGLGWTGEPPVLGNFREPLDTWADMSFLLHTGEWPGTPPQALGYVCGTLPDGPPLDQARSLADARRLTREWLERYGAELWPALRRPDGGFDWDGLYSGDESRGPGRFEWQYVAASENPSDRYVLSLPGTTKHRLGPGESGLGNLFLAGDWVKTKLNCGCVEAAVMAGMGAARAISGSPREIVGEED